jgi:hypothetical protein
MAITASIAEDMARVIDRFERIQQSRRLNPAERSDGRQ